MSSSKKSRGQFYTADAAYILDGFTIPLGATIIEPFAGRGDLIRWISLKENASSLSKIEAYDIDPKCPEAVQRDTLLDPPSYTGKFVLTNPPYLARNKSDDKVYFDKYDTNDLYKCFLMTLNGPDGGILIIPAGFFFSPRAVDVRVRDNFLTQYQVSAVRYFEEQVFPDTTTTVVALQFTKADAPLTEQTIRWTRLPAGDVREFTVRQDEGWIVGGDIYHLPVGAGTPTIGRFVLGANKVATSAAASPKGEVVDSLKPGQHLTALTLTALDSGTADGRIKLEYRPGYVYPAKDTSRSYATLTASASIDAAEQERVAAAFNTFIEERRAATWSLFLPQYRESKEYARKRIPFELAYLIVRHLLSK